MKEYGDEVTKILQEAPDARKSLLDNYTNLLDLSEYCYNNYIQVSTATPSTVAVTAWMLLCYYPFHPVHAKVLFPGVSLLLQVNIMASCVSGSQVMTV